MEKTKTVQHSVGEVSLEDNIYRLIIREGAEIDLQSAVDLIEIGTDMTKGLRVGALVDASRNFTDTNEARKYFAEHTEPSQFIAVAIITSSLAQRLIVNFYINVNHPNVPTRMFGNEADALAWLRKMMDDGTR